MSSGHSRLTTYEEIYSQKPNPKHKELGNIYMKSLPKIRQSRILKTTKNSASTNSSVKATRLETKLSSFDSVQEDLYRVFFL
jgi:hypothetical protein